MKLLYTFYPALLMPLLLLGCADVAGCERTATCSPAEDHAEAGVETDTSESVTEDTNSEDIAATTSSDNTGTSTEYEPVQIPLGPVQPRDAGTSDGNGTLHLDAMAGQEQEPTPDASSLSDGSAPPETIEPEPSTPAVFSIVIGVSGLVGNLSLSVGTEDIEVTTNGDVEVPGFADGATYVVAVVANPAGQACTVSNGEGSIAGADVVDVFVDCANDVTTLESLSLEGVSVAQTFMPSDLQYSTEVGLFVQKVTLNATLTDPLATLRINGDVVASPAVVDLPLSLGENSMEIDVTAPSGKTQQYALDVTRRETVVRREILAPNAADIEGFGYNLSVSGDFMFVDRFVEVNTGAQAFLFQYVDGAWAYLADVETLIDGPVYTIDGGVLCGDTLLVIAAPTSGASVVIYVLRNDDGWHHEQTLTTTNLPYTNIIACDSETLAVPAEGTTAVYALGEQGYEFVQNLEVAQDVSIDGDTMAIGTGESVSVYQRNPLGVWQLATYFNGFNGAGGFGTSVDVSGDWLAVGAPDDWSSYQGISTERYDYPNACAGEEDTTCTYGSGAAFLYHREALGWVEAAYVKPIVNSVAARAGTRIRLEGDLLVLDARETGSDDQGTAYLFNRGSSGWYQTNLVFAQAVPTSNDFFPWDADMTERGYFGTTVYRESGQDQVVWFE